MVENPQGDWQAEAGRKMDIWMNGGFERINTALAESGVVGSLQGMFAERGIQDQYLVFDAMETSRGFPVPVRTRYILPTFADELDASDEQAYPGIAVTEIIGLGVRTLDIQLGLGADEMQKIAQRGRAVTRSEQDWHTKRPEWWSSPRPAVDMTRDYDLTGDIKAAVDAIAEEEEHKGMLWDTYLYGSATKTPGVVNVTFEREGSRKDDVSREWEEAQAQVQDGLASLARMIDSRQKKKD